MPGHHMNVLRLVSVVEVVQGSSAVQCGAVQSIKRALLSVVTVEAVQGIKGSTGRYTSAPRRSDG